MDDNGFALNLAYLTKARRPMLMDANRFALNLANLTEAPKSTQNALLLKSRISFWTPSNISYKQGVLFSFKAVTTAQKYV